MERVVTESYLEDATGSTVEVFRSHNDTIPLEVVELEYNEHGTYTSLRPTIRKPLSKVFTSFLTKYSQENTLIVDDTPETYALNPANAIPIPQFVWGGCHSSSSNDNGDELNHDEEDVELLRVIEVLKKRLSP